MRFFRCSAAALTASFSLGLTLTGPDVAQAAAQSFGCLAYETFLHEINSIRLTLSGSSGAGADLALSGSRVFVANDAGFLDIVDVSSPATPILLPAVAVPSGRPASVEADANNVYLTSTFPHTLRSYSNSGSPTLLDSITLPTEPDFLSVDNSLAVICSGAELTLYDLSSPGAIVPRGSLTLPGPVTEIFLLGTLLYAGGGDFHVVDVTDPDVPLYLSTTSMCGGPTTGVAVLGDTAFALNCGVLFVLDVSDPFTPTIIATRLSGTEPYSLAAAGSTLWVVNQTYDSGLWAWDISVPTSPSLLGRTWTIGGALAANGQNVYASGFTNRLHVIDGSDPASPAPLGEAAAVSNASDMATFGSFSYVANRFVGLQIFDHTNPATPTLAGTLSFSGTDRLCANGSTVFLKEASGGTSSLHAVDVTSASVPLLLGTTAIPSAVHQISCVGSYLYLARGDLGLQVVDVSSPAAPVFLDSAVPGTVVFAIAGTTAYLATNHGMLHVVDLSNPAALAITGSRALAVGTGPKAITVDGPHVYITNGALAEVIDVGSPTPTPLGTFVLPSQSNNSLAVHDGILYATSTFGVTAIDIDDPNQPVVLGGTPLAGSGGGVRVHVANGYLCAVGTGSVSFQTHALQCGSVAIDAPTLNPTYHTGLTTEPNPFVDRTSVSFSLALRSRVTLDVFDIRGRRIAVLEHGTLESGAHRQVWNGCEQGGGSCPPGVYFIRLETSQGTQTIKAVHLAR